jgi:hypothetical protein
MNDTFPRANACDGEKRAKSREKTGFRINLLLPIRSSAATVTAHWAERTIDRYLPRLADAATTFIIRSGKVGPQRCG